MKGVILAGVAVATMSVAVPSDRAMATASRVSSHGIEAEALLRASFPADGPGASAIVMQRGRVIYAGGRGLADVQSRRAITPDTVFRLGSITKQFTAAVILQLVAEVRMSLDDPISRHIPNYPEPGARATVRQLLNHTSGIQDYTKVPGWIGRNRTRTFTTEELVSTIRALPAKAPPGRSWEYNNGGYVLLGALIERVTGLPWHQAVVDRIAKPLGLRTLRHSVPQDAGRSAASGYTLAGDRQQPVALSDLSVPHAAGGLVASAADLATWARALHGGRVVSPALYREMISPARLLEGTTEPYGFGLRLRELQGRPVLAHGGAIAGFDTDTLYIPSADLFVAVFANSDDPQTDPGILTQRLAALAMGTPFPDLASQAVDVGTIEPLFGSYRADNGPPRRFFSREGKLLLGRGDNEVEVLPAGQDRFFVPGNALTWIRIVRDPNGAHVMETHRPEAARPERSVRTGAAPAALSVPAAVLQSYVGRFATEGPMLVVALDASGRLTIGPAGQDPMPLRPVSETEFRVDGTPMRVVFHKDGGTVPRLTLYRGARELNGRRVP